MAQNPYEFDYNFDLGDLTGGNTGVAGPNPMGGQMPQMPGAAPVQAPFNPFGGEAEAGTRNALNAFRTQAGQQGLKVDAGDKEAYAQMQGGLGSLQPIAPLQMPTTQAMAAGQGMANPVSSFSSKLESYLDKVLSGGGQPDPKIAQQRREGIKDSLDMARKGIMSQNKADLASRGLASLPGAPSGVEASSINSINSDLGSSYAGALRDIYTSEQEQQSQNLMDALGLGVSRESNLFDREDSQLRNTLAQAQLDSQNSIANRGLDLDTRRWESDSAFKQAENLLASQLGLGRLQLDTDIAGRDAAAQQAGSVQDIIDELLRGSGTAAGGYY